jgi:hypothetical protein
VSKAVSIISPLHNLSPADLADRLGALKAEIAVLEAREKALRDELIRRNVPAIEGAVYDARITEAVRWTLNTAAVKAEMGVSWYDARCRQALVTTVKTAARVAVADKLAA